MCPQSTRNHDDEEPSLNFYDPNTGRPVRVADVRAEFKRLSRQTPRDHRAEQAFIESKIEIIQSDTHLTAKQKEDAIAELQRGYRAELR